jgi:hypothetical protein
MRDSHGPDRLRRTFRWTRKARHDDISLKAIITPHMSIARFASGATRAHGAHIPAGAEPETLERYIYQFRVGPTAPIISMRKSILPEERRPLWAGRAQVDY